MVPLHQRLEPRLHLLCRGVRLEAERIERLALGIAHRAELRQPALRSTRAGRSAELPEDAEWIIGTAEFGLKARRMGARRRPSAVHPHLPSRTMPDDGFL